MASRDFGYITLRNISAYQPNGNPVPPNQVLVTSGTGEGRFTNSLIISTICVSTVEVSTIFIDNEIASSINTNFLTVNSTSNISSLTTNSLTVISTANINSLTTNSLTVVSTANISSLITNFLTVISTANINSLNTDSLTVASTANISSLTTDFLTVNSTTLLSTTIINNTLSLIGNTPADSEIWLHNYKSRIGTSDPYGGLYLEASTTTSIWFSNLDATAGPYAQIGQDQSAFYGSVNVASTLSVSTFNTNQISTSNIQTTFVSTFNHIALFDGTSSVILDAQGSTLYVNGHPIISGGGISSVSSLFWLPGPNGTIYNENLGTLPGNYNLVGIGTNGAQLTALLDVAGTTRIASTLTVSSISNIQNISSYAISFASASNSNFIDFTTDIGTGINFDYPVLRFNSQVTNPNIQNKSLTLYMNDGTPTWTSQWENYIMQDMKFVCQDFLVSSIQDINLESQSTIYLNTLDTFVSNQLYTSTFSTNTIYMGDVNSNLSFSSILNINSGIDATDNGQIKIGTEYNPTITLGSAGSTKPISINGSMTIYSTLTTSSRLVNGIL
jgi:hypothetical protein